MTGIVILYNLIVVAFSAANAFLFLSLYFKKRQKQYFHYLFFFFSVFFTVFMIISLSLLRKDIKFFMGVGIYYNLLYSYIIFGYCMIIYSIYSYFIFIINIRLNKIVRRFILILIFSPIILVSLCIVANQELEKFILIKNLVSIITLLSFLFFSIYSILNINKINIENKGLIKLISVFLLFYFLFGIFDGLQEKLDFISLPEGFSFSSLFILIFSFSSIFIGLKYVNKNQIKNEILFKTLDREKLNRFRISEREEDVIKKIVEGKTNKEIADELFVSLSTVRTHIYNIFQKTGAKNRIEVINILSS